MVLFFALAILVALFVWVLQSHEQRWRKPGRVTRLVSGWSWKGKPPTSFAALKAVLWIYMLGVLLGVGSIMLWAPQSADMEHPVPFRTRTGEVYYVQTWVGRAVDLAVPGGCVLVVALAGVGWLHRRELLRYDRRRANEAMHQTGH